MYSEQSWKVIICVQYSLLPFFLLLRIIATFFLLSWWHYSKCFPLYHCTYALIFALFHFIFVLFRYSPLFPLPYGLISFFLSPLLSPHSQPQSTYTLLTLTCAKNKEKMEEIRFNYVRRKEFILHIIKDLICALCVMMEFVLCTFSFHSFWWYT